MYAGVNAPSSITRAQVCLCRPCLVTSMFFEQALSRCTYVLDYCLENVRAPGYRPGKYYWDRNVYAELDHLLSNHGSVRPNLW